MNDDYKVELPETVVVARGRRLRVGMIGLGIGRKHIGGWREHPDVDVVAIADPDARRLEKTGGEAASIRAILALRRCLPPRDLTW